MVKDPESAARLAPDFQPNMIRIVMKRIITAILFIVMAVSAVSCGSKADINGEWKITSVGSEAVEAGEAAPSLTFDIKTGRVNGYTGVNIVNGNFEQDGRRLQIGGLGVTMMAGPEEDMKLERAILDTFDTVRYAKTAADGTLEFLNSDGEVIMTLARR